MEKQQNDEQLEGKDGDIKMCKTELEEKQKEGEAKSRGSSDTCKFGLGNTLQAPQHPAENGETGRGNHGKRLVYRFF